MAYTQDDLTAIETAIKSGTLRVKFQDREITYRSLPELMQIRDQIRKDLGQTATTGRIKATFNKGTGC